MTPAPTNGSKSSRPQWIEDADVSRDGGLGHHGRVCTARDISERSGVPVPLLKSMEASGLIRPVVTAGAAGYTTADERAVRNLRILLAPGAPIEEFIEVAEPLLDAIADFAATIAERFLEYARQPILDFELTPREEAERSMEALAAMFRAGSDFMTYHLRRGPIEETAHVILHGAPATERAVRPREALAFVDS